MANTREDKTGIPTEERFSAPPPYSDSVPRPNIEMMPTYNTGTTVITTVVASGALVGPQPTSIKCPSCHATIITTVKIKPSTKTHIFGLILCLFCCPCMWVPYCVKSCNDATHYCPNCNAYVGKYPN